MQSVSAATQSHSPSRDSTNTGGSAAVSISPISTPPNSRPQSPASSTGSQQHVAPSLPSTPATNTPTPSTTPQPLPSAVNQHLPIPAIESLADRWWLLEAFALLVSVTSLLSLTAVLIIHDNKPLSTWTSRISLNALVSVLGAIARSSLVLPLSNSLGQWKWMRLRKAEQPLISLQHFDEAARGPWGSVQLLCRPKYFSFASFGALAIAIALAFEPFTQQAVVFPSRNTTVGQAFLPRSTYYSVPNDASSRYLAAMKVAAYENIVGLGTPALATNITATCPTGNCVWEEYTSIGVCSQCIDISDRIIHFDRDDVFESSSCKEGLTDCWINIQTPKNTVSLSWDGDGPGPIMNVTTVSQSTGLLKGYTFTSLANVTAIAMLGLANYSAHECVLYGCAKKYSATVVDGTLTEKVVKTYWNSTSPTGELGIDDNTLSGVARNISTTIQASDLETGQDEVFNFDFENTWWISDHLRSVLIGYVVGLPNNDMSFDYSMLSGIGQVSDQMAALWENGPLDFAASIEQLAEGLTNYMRLATPGGEPQASAIGIAFGRESYIHVRWPWLILPCTLELAAYLFVLGTVIATRRYDVPLWKSSSLVVWYHHATGAGTPTSSLSLVALPTKPMNQLASRTQIQLLDIADRMQLTQTGSPAIPIVQSFDRSKAVRLRRAAAKIPGAITG